MRIWNNEQESPLRDSWIGRKSFFIDGERLKEFSNAQHTIIVLLGRAVIHARKQPTESQPQHAMDLFHNVGNSADNSRHGSGC